MSIPPELSQRLHKTLLRCGPFDSNAALYTNFTDARIAAWRDRVPDSAYNRAERVSALIDALHDQYNTRGDNVLVLFLHVLHEHIPSDDCCYQELANLAYELEREFELHSPQPAAPESFAQKFAHFFFGDTEVQRAYRNRQAMLKLVHNTWIKGVLEQSLHGAALIELGMEYDPTAVDHPWDMVVQMPERPDKAVPPGTRIVDVFDDVGGSLLILGEPGSGKTTMLLELARDLIARAEQDPLQLIPVIFNLSSWAVKQPPLEEWLVEELRTKYYIPKKVAQAWVKDDVLLLLLDGLDEVKADARDKCVAAINAFREQHLVPVVVCSRMTDYEVLTAKFHLQSAVYLHPLTSAQVDAYLVGAGVELQAVRATLKHDPILQEMAESPLFLSIMILAYQGKTIAGLQSLSTSEARRQHLFDTYIEQMFLRRDKAQRYISEQTCYQLSYLAQQTIIHTQSIFLFEGLQVTWLPPRVAGKIRYLASLVIGLLYGLIFGTCLGLGGLLSGQLSGLAAIFVFGMIVGMVLGLVQEINENTGMVEPVEKIKWSWEKTFKKFPIKCFIGLFLGLVLGLILETGIVSPEFSVEPKHGLISGLYLGAITGIIWGLVGGLHKEKIAVKTAPNQGIWQSAKNIGVFGLYVGLFSWLVIVLTGVFFCKSINDLIVIVVIGILIGLLVGPLVILLEGMNWGGRAFLNHFTIRFVLHCNHYLPFRLVLFLDYCVDCIFLRRVGGGYTFVHRLLQEHFAVLTPEDIKRIAGDSRATV